jgi:tRNA U34 5-methylaminomethyl-2-thiouridine-forming methyltransferase MnmC
MDRKIILTADGSNSISIPEMNVTYHSIHGAIQESEHVFINAGFNYLISKSSDQPISLLEMGLGTGLNALLTLIETEKHPQTVQYTAVELHPLTIDESRSLNYCEQLNRTDLQTLFEKIHSCEWNNTINLTPHFTFHKINKDLIGLSASQLFNLIYYDAFAPAAQPELWTQPVFEKLYSMMATNGILVTYCSKGDVRRAMQAAGFIVEKIQGPPGKREMVRAKNHDEQN